MNQTPRKYIWLIGVVALYAWCTAVLAWRDKSPTWDEPAHLTAGYAYLTRGAFALYAVNPPLAKEYAALPLLLWKPPLPSEQSRHWKEGKINSLAREFLYGPCAHADRAFAWVRPWMALLGALILLALFFWTSRWLHPEVGLIAAVLLASNPSYLAYLPLATTDVAFTLASVLLAWSLLRLWKQPGWRSSLVVGIAWGGCLATKHTGMIYLPVVLGALLVASVMRRRKGAKGSLLLFIGRTTVAFAAAGVVVWASYGFQTSPMFQGPDDRAKLVELVRKATPLPHETAAKWARGVASLSVPARPYVVSALDMLGLRPTLTQADSGFERLKYLCGRRHPHGFHEFTLVALAIKNPLPFLLALVIGLWGAPLLPGPLRSTIFAMVAILFAVGTVKRDFAFRYFALPMLPFLALLAGHGLWLLIHSRRRWSRILAVGLILWAAFVPWRHFPHFLAYFNPLVGGPEGGVRCLLASNSDWGQDLPLLARWQRENNVGALKLAYNGTVPPEHYGIVYEELPGVNANTFESRPDSAALASLVARTCPDTGMIAISTTCLYNIQGFYPGADYTWLLSFDPIASLGHTIRVYHVRSIPGRPSVEE